MNDKMQDISPMSCKAESTDNFNEIVPINDGGSWGKPSNAITGMAIELKKAANDAAVKRLQDLREYTKENQQAVAVLKKGITGAFNRLRRPEGTVQEINKESTPIAICTPDAMSWSIPILREDAEEPKSIANFTLDVLGEVVHWTSETQKKIIVELLITMVDFVNDNSSVKLRIPLEDYHRLPSVLRSRHPQCIISDLGKFCEEIAKKYKVMHEKQLGHERYYYEFGGWTKDQQGNLMFLDNSRPDVSSEVLLGWDLAKAQRFLPLYTNTSKEIGKLLVLLLFVLWAPLARFFEECKIEKRGLRTLAYVSAPSGTGKTTLLSFLTSGFLADDVKPCLRFEDTEASLEESLFQKRDIPTLVDDFFAQATRTGDEAYTRKASALTRIAGDGLIKSKMGPDRKPKPDRKFRGSIIATGEFLHLNTFSSELRCWHIAFPAGSINLDANMAKLTQDVSFARAYFTGWVRFLEKAQENLLANLPEMLAKKESLAKETLKGNEFKRLGSYVATLLLLGDLFYEYNSQLNVDSFGSNKILDLIFQEATQQVEALEAKSPDVVWRQAVLEAVESGVLNIVKDKDTFIREKSDGYFSEDKRKVFCVTGRVQEAVRHYARENGVGLRLTKDLKLKLVSKGYIEQISEDELGYRFSCERAVAPVRPRMYAINLY